MRLVFCFCEWLINITSVQQQRSLKLKTHLYLHKNAITGTHFPLPFLDAIHLHQVKWKATREL